MANVKVLDKAIEHIDTLSRLAAPTKRRVRKYMKMNEVDDQGFENISVKFPDILNIDLYYVIDGKLLFNF